MTQRELAHRGRLEGLMERIVYRTCTLCEACCGIEVHVDGDRIARIRGDKLDPLSRGYICPKALALKDLHEDPDRLRHPLSRTRTGWERISWQDALDRAARGIIAVQRRHGRNAVALYRGEPVTHNLGATLFGDELVKTLATSKHFSANTLDQMPKQLASHWMYGSGFLLSVPDVDRTAYMLIIGANPLVSNGSVMTAPGVRDRLRGVQRRGGRVVVIDPRRTETARLADEHHFIRPGTDPLLVAALLNTLFAEGRVRIGRLSALVEGLETVREAVGDLTPEAVTERVGIAPQTIRTLARAFSDAPRAVCYGRMGTCTVRFGTVTSWLIEVLNIATGNLDRPGGAMFPNPPVDVIRLQPQTQRGRWHSRVCGTPEFIGELPAATLAAEIDEPGADQVHALVTLAGNPVLSSPAGHVLEDALRRLEFMVSIDFYLNETTRHAHVILPPTGPLERDHFDIVFQLFAVRVAPRWSPAVFRPPSDTRSDGDILLELCRRLSRAGGGLARVRALIYRALLGLGAERTARLAVALALRAGPHGSGLLPWRRGLTLRKLREAAHGVDLGPMEACLPERLPGDRKRIDLAPREIVADIARLRRSLGESGPETVLIGRREPRTVNSWSHNLPSLTRGQETCVLHVHPRDATARGIENGRMVRVTSRVGTIVVPAMVTETVMRGVVSLPHGHGHRGAGIRMRVAAERPGASMNDLTDPTDLELLTGTAVLNGVPVRVEPA